MNAERLNARWASPEHGRSPTPAGGLGLVLGGPMVLNLFPGFPGVSDVDHVHPPISPARMRSTACSSPLVRCCVPTCTTRCPGGRLDEGRPSLMWWQTAFRRRRPCRPAGPDGGDPVPVAGSGDDTGVHVLFPAPPKSCGLHVEPTSLAAASRRAGPRRRPPPPDVVHLHRLAQGGPCPGRRSRPGHVDPFVAPAVLAAERAVRAIASPPTPSAVDWTSFGASGFMGKAPGINEGEGK